MTRTTSARTARILDWVILLAVLAVLLVRLTGGFYAEPFGIRFSIRKFERPLLLAVGLVLLRRWLAPGHGFLGIEAAKYRGWWNAYFQRDADRLTTPEPSWPHTAIALTALVATTVAMLHQQLAQMYSVPDYGDPLFSIWRTGWVAHQIAGDPRALFDANILYPTPLALTLSDSMLLPSTMAWPLLVAGMHPVAVYNTLLISAFVLSGVTTFFLIRRLTRSLLCAFIGGLMYAFYPYRLEHYSHFELTMTHWMPLCMLLLLRFRDSLRLRDAVLAGLCLVAQVYSSMYSGVQFPPYAVTVVGILLFLSRTSWRRLVTPSVVTGAIALVLTIPLAVPYARAQGMKGDRDEGTVRFYSADLSDFLRPHSRLATHAGHWLPDVNPERALFPGVTPVVLSAVALAPPIGEIRLAFAAGMLVAGDMTQGLKGTLYPFLYKYFPPVRGMRVPARASIVMGISLAVLAAFGMRRLLARLQTPQSRTFAWIAMAALVLIDLRPKLDLVPVWREPPGVYEALKQQPGPIVLAEFPFETNRPLVTNEIPYQYFSLWHWMVTVNGYTGFVPKEHKDFVEAVRNFPDAASFVALRMHGVTHVTMNCYFWEGNCAGAMNDADRNPNLVRIKSATWEGKAVRLYELKRP